MHFFIQSQNYASNWRVRSVTACLLVTALILTNAYSAGLASVFTIPTYEKSIDTIQDIIDRKVEWGATHDAWVYSLTLSEEVNHVQRTRFEREYFQNNKKLGILCFFTKILFSAKSPRIGETISSLR